MPDLPLKPSALGAQLYFEQRDSVLTRMVEEWRRDPSGIQKWVVVSPQHLKRIWGDFVRTGAVRDIRGLDRLCERAIENIIRIDLNTELSGHTQHDPADVVADFDLTKSEVESFANWAISIEPRNADDDSSSFKWRISDSAMIKLFPLAALLLGADTPEKKATYLNMVMDVAHQRCDLSSWFVEGGQAALSEISGQYGVLETTQRIETQP